MIDAAAAIADLQDALTRNGETVTIRRMNVGNPPVTQNSQPMKARVLGYQPEELVGDIIQGDRKVIIGAQDDDYAPITLPLVKGDKIVIRGVAQNIQAVDDNTRRIGDTLIGYELQVRGTR